MRSDRVKLIDNQPMTGAIVSNGVDLQQIVDASVQAVYTGSPVGSLIIEISNDLVDYANQSNAAANVVNWTVYGTPSPISAAGSTALNFPDIGFKWFRVRYSFTSGSGSLTVNYFAKGA